MTYKELQEVKTVLGKIKNKDTKCERAIAYVDKDIALCEAQANAKKYNKEYDIF